MDNTVAVALVAGMLGLFLVIQMNLQKTGQAASPAAESSTSKSAAPSAAAASKKKKKPKKKKAAAVAPEPEPEPEPEPVVPAASKKKKKKKNKAAAPVVEAPAPAPVVEAPAPAPTPEPVPEPAPAAAAGGKKKKKKKNKNGAAAAANTPPTAATTTATTNGSTAPSSAPPPVDEDDGFITIPKNNRKSKQAAAQAAAATVQQEGGITTTTLKLSQADIPLLIGPKGATIQRLTAETGAKIDVDKQQPTNNGNNAVAGLVKISGEEANVQLAVSTIQTMIAEATAARDAATAHTATLSGAQIKGSEGGVKAIIGKAGSTIKSIQTTTGCQLKASIDEGTVVISGPTVAAVAQATQLCKNAVFGEVQSQIDLQTQAMVMAVCGKGFVHLRSMQDESKARLDFILNPAGKKTLLHISGDKDAVAKAKTLIAARMGDVAGVSMEFEASKTGAIYGKGGTTLRRIQDTTGATVEVMDASQAPAGTTEGMGVCKILGEAAAVSKAKDMIDKALSGEVELKAGEVLDKIDCGVGAAAVIGRGGSKIAELEKEHKVKLNVQSGSGECSIVGKKDNVAAAKEAIEKIVEPLKQKAIDEAEMLAAAEELAASGDDTWGAADGAGSWDDAVEENGW